MPGVLTNGLPTVAPVATSAAFPALLGVELLPADTELASGTAPQTVAATTFQVAALYAAMAGNTGTASSGAVTKNTLGGLITTDSLSLAPGATYTLTITNSNVAANSNVRAAVYSLSNVVTGLRIQSITPAAGSVVIVLVNTNASASVSGTAYVPFLVAA